MSLEGAKNTDAEVFKNEANEYFKSTDEAAELFYCKNESNLTFLN